MFIRIRSIALFLANFEGTVESGAVESFGMDSLNDVEEGSWASPSE